MKNNIKSNEEKLITFLNNKFQNSRNNQISISEIELPDIGLTELETLQAIYLLKEDGLIDIVKKSIHDDFSTFWTVALKSNCVHYFEHKKEERNIKIREWFWWGVTTLLSIVALVVAIIAL